MIAIQECAGQIAQTLPKGILLNTQGDKFNSMVIAWGHIGFIWNQPTFVAYVRQSRYTRPQLDKTLEFVVSSPLAGGTLSPQVMRVCGSQSGYDVDKAGLFTLVPGRSVRVPAIREYPLTLECRVLYRQNQSLEQIPPEVLDRFYRGEDAGDYHTAYIARIVDAYVLE